MKTRIHNRVEGSLALAISAVGTSEFFPNITDYLRANVDFIGVFVTELRGRNQPLHIYDNVRSERRVDVVDTYLERSYMLDPFFDAHLKNPTTRVARLAEVAPDRFLSSTYYMKYYKDLKLQDEIGIFVRLSNAGTLFFSLGRHTHERKFSKSETARFRRILPIFKSLNIQHFNGVNRSVQPAAVGLDVDEAMLKFAKDVLTPRESEIAGLVLKGHSTHSIADQTGIAVGTTKIHRKNLYRKLNISSQAELFHKFFESVFD